MVRIAVMFPNVQEKHFDADYYRNKHLPLVKEKYSQHGLQAVQIDTALTTSGKHAAPYVAIGYMLFESINQFMQAFEADGKSLMDDIVNFTDIEPIVQISQSDSI